MPCMPCMKWCDETSSDRGTELYLKCCEGGEKKDAAGGAAGGAAGSTVASVSPSPPKIMDVRITDIVEFATCR